MTTTTASWHISGVEAYVTGSGMVEQSLVITGAYIGRETGPQSRAIGMREVDLTPQEAAHITRLLDDPSVPTHAGKPVPAGDVSLLRQRVH